MNTKTKAMFGHLLWSPAWKHKGSCSYISRDPQMITVGERAQHPSITLILTIIIIMITTIIIPKITTVYTLFHMFWWNTGVTEADEV